MQLSSHTQSARTAATSRVAQTFSSCMLLTSVLVASLASPSLPLPTSSLAQETATTESSTWFPCHLNYVVEDYYEEQTSFQYALCTGENDQSVIIPQVHDHEETEFVPNELVSVSVSDSTTAVPAAGNTKSVMHAGGVHALHQNADDTTIMANTDVAIAAPARARRATSTEPAASVTGLRSVLLLRVNYNGASPDYCDEACVAASLESVDGVYQDMSNNKVRFPSWMAEIKTVTITDGKHGSSGCSYWNIAMEADQAARDLGLNPSDYQHTVYYLPREFENSKCTFGGLAFLGCTYPTCKVWLRNAYAPTLAHELGHNLNAKHSGTDLKNDGNMENQYGDNSDLMGFQKYWRGMNAPHLVELGWMPESAVKQVGAECTAETSDFVTISALGNAAATDLQVVTFTRAAAKNVDEELAVDGVGKYFLSYRAPHGVDELFGTPNDAKKNQYADKVFLHYTLDKFGAQQNTMLVKVMEEGDVYTDETTGVTITVIKINKAGAKADVHVSACNGLTTTAAAETTTTTTTSSSTTTTTTSTTTTSTATTTSTSTSTTQETVNTCVTSLDRFGEAQVDVRGHGSYILGSVNKESSSEACATACITFGAECESFSYAAKTGACRIYKEDAFLIDVPAVQMAVHHVIDNECLATLKIDTEVEVDEDVVTTTTPAPTTKKASCKAINPFKARPKCGASANGSECCPGLKCAGKKNNAGVKTFRCAVNTAKKTVPLGGSCSSNSQCSTKKGKCNSDLYVCQTKDEWLAFKSSKSASRTRRVSIAEEATAATPSAGSAMLVGIIAMACIVVAVIVFAVARKNTSATVVDVSAGTFVCENSLASISSDAPAILIMV